MLERGKLFVLHCNASALFCRAWCYLINCQITESWSDLSFSVFTEINTLSHNQYCKRKYLWTVLIMVLAMNNHGYKHHSQTFTLKLCNHWKCIWNLVDLLVPIHSCRYRDLHNVKKKQQPWNITPKTKTHQVGAHLILCSNLNFGCCCRISTCIRDQKEQRAHLRLLKLVEVWCDIEEDSIHGTGQRDTTAKQDEQHEVRVRGREVHHLRGTKSWLLQNNLSKPSLRSPENIWGKSAVWKPTSS